MTPAHAHWWKGGGYAYDTLEECFKTNSHCQRMEISRPVDKKTQTTAAARKAVPASSAPDPTPQQNVKACDMGGGRYHKPPCKSGEKELYVQGRSAE